MLSTPAHWCCAGVIYSRTSFKAIVAKRTGTDTIILNNDFYPKLVNKAREVHIINLWMSGVEEPGYRVTAQTRKFISLVNTCRGMLTVLLQIKNPDQTRNLRGETWQAHRITPRVRRRAEASTTYLRATHGCNRSRGSGSGGGGYLRGNVTIIESEITKWSSDIERKEILYIITINWIIVLGSRM